jgi:hypothetical protein
MTKKTCSVLKKTVRTPTRSHAQMSLAWRVKNVRQVGEGTPSWGRRMYLATVRADTGNPQPGELRLDAPLSPQAILDGHAPDQGP